MIKKLGLYYLRFMKNIFRVGLLLILLAIILISGFGYSLSFDGIQKNEVYAATVTTNVSIAASADDILVSANGTTVSLTLSYTYIGKDGAGWAGRFLTTVPQGTVVTHAYLYGTCFSNGSGTTVNWDIFGEATDNANVFSTAANYQGRRGTAAGGADDTHITTHSTAVNGVSAWTAGTIYLLGDVTSIVNEILARPGWVSGNYLALFVDDLKDRDSTSNRRLTTWDDTTKLEPYLVIEYEGATVVPTVTSGTSSAITATTANCTGTITNTGGEDADSVCIQYGTATGVYTGNVTVTDTYGTGIFNIQLTGLTPATYYYWRAGAHNSAGWAFGSEGVAFPTDASGLFSITNPYTGGNRYKGNLHIHTINSDGDFTPTEAVTMYLNAGYDFIALTDHNIITPDPEVGGILVIPGQEKTVTEGHLLVIGSSTNYTGTTQEVINSYYADGAVLIANHPNNVVGWSEEALNSTTNLTGVNILDSHYHPPSSLGESKWSYALTHPSDRTIWGEASDDMHQLDEFNLSWIEVFAPSCNLTNILSSIKAGNFIASSGANVTGISLAGNTLTISSDVSSTITFKGRDGLILQKDTSTTSASYTFGGGEVYVRAVVSNANGYAYIQPFFIDNATAPIPPLTTNHAPVLTVIGNKTVNEGSPLNFSVSATDPDGDNLVYSASGLPAGATINPTTGLFSWTPSYVQAGVYNNIHFSVTDSVLSDWENITITVNNVNGAPVLSAIGNKSVYEGSPLNFTVSATDPDGDNLVYSASGLPSGASFNGTSRVFSWIPGTGSAGTYINIQFNVSDGTVTRSETITIIVGVIPPANPTPAPAGAGGGGGSSSGGGGGASGITSLLGSVNASGRTIEEIDASDNNLKLTVHIPFGTLIKNRVGQAVTSIRITPQGENTAANPGSVLIGKSYEVEPSGATFEDAAFIIFRYTPSDIPAGIAANKLYIALWDPVALVWTDLGGTVNPDARTITVPTKHFSTYALMARTRPADFNLSNVTLSAGAVFSGETVTASIDINNQGDLSGNYTVSFKINNLMAQTRDISLSGGCGEKVSFTFAADAAGEYQIDIGGVLATIVVKKPLTPAAFNISSLTISPLVSNIGDNIDASAVLNNTGDMAGTYKIVLAIDDNIVDTEEVTIEGNSNVPFGFSFIADKTGQHKVSIGGLIAPFEVKIQMPVLPPSANPNSKLELSSYSIAPSYDKTTNALIYTMVTFQMDQDWVSFPDTRLMMTVFHDSQFLEQIPLFTMCERQQDGRSGKLSYTPPEGWQPGEYAFRAELFNGEELIQDTPLRRLSVTPESAASVVSWKTLGIIIGSALVLGSLILTLVLYYRRDMLRDYWK
jgi:hypothetical protein